MHSAHTAKQNLLHHLIYKIFFYRNEAGIESVLWTGTYFGFDVSLVWKRYFELAKKEKTDVCQYAKTRTGEMKASPGRKNGGTEIPAWKRTLKKILKRRMRRERSWALAVLATKTTTTIVVFSIQSYNQHFAFQTSISDYRISLHCHLFFQWTRQCR